MRIAGGCRGIARQCGSPAPGRRRALAPSLYRLRVRRSCGISSPARLPISGKHLGSLNGCSRSRDGSGGGPWPLPSSGGLSRFARKVVATMGCTSSSEWASAPLRACWLEGSRPVRAAPRLAPSRDIGFGLVPLTANEGKPSAAPRRMKVRFGRGSSVGLVCSSFVLVVEVSKRRQAQRSHSGCGRNGGRGPSSGGSEVASRSRSPATAIWGKGLRRTACWWKASWVVEPFSLHGLAGEAVLGRRRWRSAPTVAGRHGCQSFDALAPAVVKSPTGSEG